ncbi:MAG: ATP-binding cassette domain-containing protein [Oscillospiraceae bacterium]|nr:ATP-binding cassette domain-containing protein [Oscillospiraceae bacterium]
MSEIAIKFDHVSKEYRLGAIGGGTLKGDLQSFMAKIRGKEDPNLMIGAKTYNGNEKFLALDDISFEVRKGEALGIIGHNGAGKSTLLKLLSRVTAPSKGTISYNGRIASMLEVGTGFHPELTGRENVYMNGAILGMTKAEIDKKFDEIVAFAEMEKFIDTPVKRYSSGMYVKLAFSVAAHLDSEIMVMDEVLAVGDMKFQQKCLGRMGDAANEEGRTVLYVSHNMNTIRQLCTRCLVLDHGKIIFAGDVEQAIEIYMKSQGDVSCTDYDLSKKSSRDPGATPAKLMRLQIREKQNAVYEIGESLTFDVEILARRAFEHLRFRFELRYADDVPVGTIPDLDLGAVSEGEQHTYRMTFDTHQLTRGKYKVFLVLFERNEFGTCQDHDLVLPAFYFEMQDGGEITWNTSQWGHIRFQDMSVDRLR